MSESVNGGITVKIDDFEIKQLNRYDVSWEYEEAERFENWDFTTVTVPKGYRFNLSLTANNLTPEKKTALMKKLFARVFTLDCPDFNGVVELTGSVGAPVKIANRFGTWYNVSFSVAAVSLDATGGSL